MASNLRRGVCLAGSASALLLASCTAPAGSTAVKTTAKTAAAPPVSGAVVYDAARKVWHQTWVTNRGQLLTIEGRFEGDRLTLQGRQRSPDAAEKIVRGVWKPEGDGVRETAHTSDDGGATWRPLFDIRFQRRKARAAGLSKSTLGALVEAGLLLRGRISPAIVQRYMAA